jgi:hypothetical protein
MDFGQFTGIIFFAIVIEALICYTRTFIVDRRPQWQIIFGVLIGIGISFAYGIDLFEIAGYTSTVEHIGPLLTGVLLSRGSNYVFDFIGKMTVKNVDKTVQPVGKRLDT